MGIIRILVGAAIAGNCGAAVVAASKNGDTAVMFLAIAFGLFVGIFPFLVKWAMESK